MPNIYTVPRVGMSWKRNVAADDHLNNQHPAPALPLVPSNAQIGISSRFQTVTRSAEGFSRSKSSPNLQQRSTQESQQYSDGFNFELPGSVPAMYSSSPQSGRDSYHSNTYDKAAYQHSREEWQQNTVVNGPQISARPQEPLSRPSTGESYGRLPHSQSPGARNQHQCLDDFRLVNIKAEGFIKGQVQSTALGLVRQQLRPKATLMHCQLILPQSERA